MSVQKNESSKLFNRNLVLLLQGFFVSSAGSAIYQIALGFWILASTGSTAMMGFIMASITIPNLIVGPFSGVLADRFDRKKLIVFADLIQGAAVVVVGTFAYLDKLEVWLVVVCGMIIGLCTSVFLPTVNSVLPDIVLEKDLTTANSLNGIVTSISTILGNSIGGVLYVILGAPFMFLLNGVTFLLSAVSEMFMKIPKVVHEKIEFSFFADIKNGFSYLIGKKSIFKLGIITSLINLFLVMAIILMMPYFDGMKQFDSRHYGYAVTAVTIGGIIGFLIIGLIKIQQNKTFIVFLIFAVLFSLSRTIPLMFPNFIYIITCLFFLGVSLSVINTLINTVLQKSIDQNMRGRVFALFGVLNSGLAPLGMALGGILAEYFQIEYIILITGCIQFSFFVLLFLDSDVRSFINGNSVLNEIEE